MTTKICARSQEQMRQWTERRAPLVETREEAPGSGGARSSRNDPRTETQPLVRSPSRPPQRLKPSTTRWRVVRGKREADTLNARHDRDHRGYGDAGRGHCVGRRYGRHNKPCVLRRQADHVEKRSRSHARAIGKAYAQPTQKQNK